MDVIGKNVKISFGKRAVDVPAKIDTGADSSAIWASKIRVGKDGVLRFALFGEGSSYYSGKMFKRTDFDVAMVKSSSGHKSMRYRTKFKIKLNNRIIKTKFSLADRSDHEFPVLIGCRTIRGKFLVDVSRADFAKKNKNFRTFNKEFEQDPYKFYKKYHKNKN